MTYKDDNHKYLVLDGLRGVAAICVMFRHFNDAVHLNLFGRELFNPAILAVDTFFSLSGFVLIYSYGKKLDLEMSVQTYILKRIFRLYPLYFMSLILGAGVNSHLSKMIYGTYDFRALYDIISFNIFYLPYPNNDYVRNFGVLTAPAGRLFPLNPPAWSLFFEIIVSILFIYFYKMSIKNLLWILSVSLLMLLPSGIFLSIYNDKIWGFNINIGWGIDNFAGGLPRVLYGFCLGLVLYKSTTIREKVTKVFSILRVPEILYSMLFMLLLIPIGARGSYQILYLIVISPIIITVGASSIIINKFQFYLSKSLGWLSYPLYCFHFPVGRAIFYYGDIYGVAPVVSMSIAISTTILLSVIVGTLFETPLRALLTRLFFEEKTNQKKPILYGEKM